MNIDELSIRKNIRAVLLAVDNADMPSASSIAWENHEYRPVIGKPWIRETMIPGTERQSASDTLQSVGIMQYDFFWPANKGTTEIENLVIDVKAAFRPATVLDAHSLAEKIEQVLNKVQMLLIIIDICRV